MARFAPRIPGASVLAGWELPPEHDWEAIENHTTHLTSDQKTELKDIINSYVSYAEAEQAASQVPEAKYLLSAQRKAGSLLLTVIQGRRDKAVNRQLDEAVNSAMKQQSQGLGINDFTLALTDFVSACDVVQKQLRDSHSQSADQPGTAWREIFIPELAAFWERIGHQASARKDTDLRRMSPFVDFVAAVQATFPDGFREHSQSNEALAHAISGVLSELRAK